MCFIIKNKKILLFQQTYFTIFETKFVRFFHRLTLVVIISQNRKFFIMKKIILIFSITFLITSCNEKKRENIIETKTNSKVIKKEVKEISCKCFDGIGSSKDDNPILEMNFSNGQKISVCGFLRKRNGRNDNF